MTSRTPSNPQGGLHRTRTAEVDQVIAQTRKQIGQISPSAHRFRRPARAPERLDTSEYETILDNYFGVKLILINKFIEAYSRRSLAGDVLSEQNRIRWMEFYRQMESVLNLASLGVTLDAPDFGSETISEQDVPKWKNAARAIEMNHPDALFDERAGMALSSIMLMESEGRRPPEQACAVGRHYVTRAKDDESKMKSPPLNLDEADISRLHGYLLQLDARLDASCERR